jgi:hypothetical protein
MAGLIMTRSVDDERAMYDEVSGLMANVEEAGGDGEEDSGNE